MVGHSACEEVPLLFPSFFIPFFIFSSSACSPFLKGLALPFPFPFPFPRFLENLLVPCFNFIILLFKFLAPGRGTQSLSPRNSTWGYMLLQVVSKLVIGLFFWLFLLFECVGGFDSFLDIAASCLIKKRQVNWPFSFLEVAWNSASSSSLPFFQRWVWCFDHALDFLLAGKLSCKTKAPCCSFSCSEAFAILSLSGIS